LYKTNRDSIILFRPKIALLYSYFFSENPSECKAMQQNKAIKFYNFRVEAYNLSFVHVEGLCYCSLIESFSDILLIRLPDFRKTDCSVNVF